MTWWHYLLLANIYLTLFYAFYRIFLRKETFFNLNRIYLVGGAVLSFAIPLIQSEWIKSLFITQKVQQTIYQVNPMAFQFTVSATHTHHLTLGEVIGAIYALGITVLTCKLIYQLIKLQLMITQRETPVTFSFFNNIRIEENDADNELINAHEEAHAKQWHSADIMLIEAIMIINWFNPVVYLYRNAIKHIHEFIADRDALLDGKSKAEYAMLLLAQTFAAPPHRMVNPFFTHSMLKERILMLQKNKSQRIMLFKYWLSAPLFALMLILSSATVNNSQALQALNDRARQIFASPANLNELMTGHNPQTETIQADHLNTGNPNTYASLEQMAEFPGGDGAFVDFLSHNVHYPKDVDAEGKVYISFIVEKDGSLSNYHIMQSLAPAFDYEALRVMRLSPKWEPAIQNGQPIRVRYTVPISFTLFAKNTKPAVAGHPQWNTDDEIFTAVENSASFPGGIERFYQYLSTTVRYPDAARDNNVEGKVFATFVVERDGSISDIRVLKGIGSGCDEEAVRVLSNMPKWNPGTQNGYAVRQQYTVPISFSLTGDDDKPHAVAPRDTAGIPKVTFLHHGPETTTSNKIYSLTYTTPDTLKKQSAAQTVQLLNKAAGSNKPAYVIDGKFASEAAVMKTPPQTIEAINVYKAGLVPAIYSDKGKNGVVVITTKKTDKGLTP